MHAQHNEHALLRKVVTVEQVVSSPMVSTPLHRLDCCVVTDGGGALVLVGREDAEELGDRCVKILGHGEAVEHTRGGHQDITVTGAVRSGRDAFAEAWVTPGDIDYVGIYDSFTITVLLALVELDEGPKMITNIVDCDPADITIGMPVEVVFHACGPAAGDPALPRFRPVSGCTSD